MPKKQQIKLSPGSGRRVRWTVEVSADVGAEKPARAKKPVKKAAKTAAKRPATKRTRVRSTARVASPSALPQVQATHDSVRPQAATTAVAAAPVVAQQPAVESTSTVAKAPLQTTPQPTRGQMGALAAAAVLVIALVAIPQQPASEAPQLERPTSEPLDSTVDASNPSPATPAPAPRAAAIAAPPNAKTRALTELPKKSSVRSASNRTTVPETPTSPLAVAAIDTAPTATESTTKPVPEPTPTTPSPAPAASLPPVTITGCLEISTDGDEFRLADTEGADAPKSRSWRSGFLKRRTAPVTLVGAPDPLSLKKSVGKRIAATGLLASRELQVSSLRVVGSCN